MHTNIEYAQLKNEWADWYYYFGGYLKMINLLSWSVSGGLQCWQQCNVLTRFGEFLRHVYWSQIQIVILVMFVPKHNQTLVKMDCPDKMMLSYQQDQEMNCGMCWSEYNGVYFSILMKTVQKKPPDQSQLNPLPRKDSLKPSKVKLQVNYFSNRKTTLNFFITFSALT